MQAFIAEIIERIRSEPILVTTAIGAVLTALVAFNVPLTEQQVAGLIAVAAALMAIIARSQVTPTHAPTLAEGTTVSVEGSEKKVAVS